MTQAQLAEIIGCSAPRVSEWERDVRTPKKLTQQAMIQKILTHNGHQKPMDVFVVAEVGSRIKSICYKHDDAKKIKNGNRKLRISKKKVL